MVSASWVLPLPALNQDLPPSGRGSLYGSSLANTQAGSLLAGMRTHTKLQAAQALRRDSVSPIGLNVEPVLYAQPRPGGSYTNAKISIHTAQDQFPNTNKAGVFLGFPKHPGGLKEMWRRRRRQGIFWSGPKCLLINTNY